MEAECWTACLVVGIVGRGIQDSTRLGWLAEDNGCLWSPGSTGKELG